jgi:tetratricopeptide (TPR) repeat protein
VKTIGKLAVVAALALSAAAAGAELTLLSLAKRGDAEAQYLVGMAYLEGRQVTRDPAEGIRWLRHAASQRNVQGRFALATLYREGRGVPQNLPAAVRLFGDGAAAQHRESQFALAQMYGAGQGVPRDDALAVKLLNEAAWANLPEAQALLGEWFYRGKGVEKNRNKAWRLLKLSGDAIRPRGRKILEEIDPELSEMERAFLLRRVREYRVQHPRVAPRKSSLTGLPVVEGAKPEVATGDDPDETAKALSPEALATLERAESLVAQGLREGDAGLVAEAVALADERLTADPSDARALLVKARVDIAEGRLAEASERLRAAVAQRPDWGEAHFWLASTLERRGELPGARDEFARALRLDGGLIEARAALVRIHVALGEHEAAVTQARLVLADVPGDVATRDVLVESLMLLDRGSDALRMLQAIREEDRDAAVRTAMGRIYLELGQARSARESLMRANAEAPHQSETLRALLRLDAAEGRLPDSVARIEDALTVRSDDPSLHRLAGIAALHEGRAADAEQSLERALALDPSDVESTLRLGRHYTASGRTQEAIHLYERALQALPDESGIHHRLGGAYESRGDRDRAIEQYEAAIRHDPGHGPAKDDLGRLLADDPKTADRAFALAGEARALMPNEVGPAVTLGKVHLARGDLLAAIRLLQRAEARLEPGDPRLGEVRYLLGRSYLSDGQFALSRETLERALSEIDTRGDPREPLWAAGAREMLARLDARR